MFHLLCDIVQVAKHQRGAARGYARLFSVAGIRHKAASNYANIIALPVNRVSQGPNYYQLLLTPSSTLTSTTMSLSIPSAPNGGLFKQGYQK